MLRVDAEDWVKERDGAHAQWRDGRLCWSCDSDALRRPFRRWECGGRVRFIRVTRHENGDGEADDDRQRPRDRYPIW
jgi:hypothetical protein